MAALDCATPSEWDAGTTGVVQVGVFEQEEAALDELEVLVAKMPQTLLGSEPRELLDAVQHIEEVCGRLSRLETALSGLAAQRVCTNDGAPDGSPARVAEAFWPLATPDLSGARHRLLGKIARIAQHNDANAALIAGLVRASSATISMLRHWQENAAQPPFKPGSESRGWSAPATLDLQV